MLTIIEIILPVFGLIALGYGFGKKNFISENGIADITRFIFYLAIPALLFRTASEGMFAQPLETEVLLAYYGSAVVTYFLAYLFIGPLFKLPGDEKAVMAMGGTFSNIVLIGLPVIQTAFGPAGLVPLMTILALNAMVLFTIPSVLVELSRGESTNVLAIIKTGLSTIFTNPIVLSLMIGGAYGFTGWGLPGPADRFLEILGSAAGPCALFVVGATLAQFSLAGNMAQSMAMTVMKLLVMPLGFFLLATYVFELSPLWVAVGTIIAGLPTGANMFILARRYDVYVNRASTTVLVSTLVAVVTLTVLLAIFLETA